MEFRPSVRRNSIESEVRSKQPFGVIKIAEMSFGQREKKG